MGEPKLPREQLLAQVQELRDKIAHIINGPFPSADDIGPPEGDGFAARARRLVDRASVYHSFKTLSAETIDRMREYGPKNPQLATSLLLWDLIYRCLHGDETARNALALLAHLEVQLSHALDVAMNKIPAGRKAWDGDFLALYGKMITAIDRVRSLMAGGMSKTNAWEQAAKELGLTTDQVRGYYEGGNRTS